MVGVARIRAESRLAALFDEAVDYLAHRQRELSAEPRDGFFEVRGKFIVNDAQGPLDSFDIVLTVGPDFPAGQPRVWEVGGRIPRTMDRHVFERDGSLCLGIWEAWLAKTPTASFAAFMEGPVADYFFGQSLVEIGEPWPFGERAHGLPGVLAAYGETLGLNSDLEAIKSYLRFLSLSSLKGHHWCPCGSERRVRDCHWDSIQVLAAKVPPQLAARMLRRLLK